MEKCCYLEESFIIIHAIFPIWPRFANDFRPFDQLQSLNLLLDEVASQSYFVHALHFLRSPGCMHLAAKVALPQDFSSGDINQRFMEVGRSLEVKVGVDDPRWRNCGTSRMLRLEKTNIVRRQLSRQLT